jgi:hypothetical protein
MLESLALQRLTVMTAASVEPVLDATTLSDLLLQCRVIDRYGNPPDPYHSWTPTTAYTVGTRVVRALRGQYELQLGGHIYYIYECATAGTSGANEPAWPDDGITGNIVDGTVRWNTLQPSETLPMLNTTYWAGNYNLNYGAAKGWLYKAGELQGNYGLTIAGSQLQRNQAYTQAIQQYRYYMKKASISSAGLRRARHVPGDSTSPLGPLPIDSKFGGEYFTVGDGDAPHIGRYIALTDGG